MTEHVRCKRNKSASFLGHAFFFFLLFATGACSTTRGTASLGEASAHAATETVKAKMVDPIDVKAELSAAQAMDGSLVIVSIHMPKTANPESIEGIYEEEKFQFYPAAQSDPASQNGASLYEALLAVPYNHKPGKTQVQIRYTENNELKQVDLPLVVVDGNYASEQLHVDPRRVKVDRRKDQLRAAREKEEVGKIYAHVTRKKFWTGPFQLPINSSITSNFGTKRVFNGEMNSYHGGLDLKAKIGTPIHAAGPGVVVLSKNLFFTGNTVMIDHGYGLITLYAHMSKLKVKKGQKVKTNQVLGLSGKTGRVSGPHLHWQAIVHRMKINPLELTKVLR